MLDSLLMRRLMTVVLLLIATGCHTCPVAPTPRQRADAQSRHRPQDMTDRVLGDKRYPEWLKKNYAEWIRYAYDLEVDPR